MTEFRPVAREEYDDFFTFGRRAFPMISESDRDARRHQFRPEDTRAIFEGDTMKARLLGFPLGHHLGGRVVRAIGIAGVAVDPTSRGRGLGTRLMRLTQQQARSEGIPLASLYPATQPLYRSLGYGDAFHRTAFKAPLEKLPQARDLDASVEVMREEDEPDLKHAYSGFARTQAGALFRDDHWWTSRVFDPKQASQRYLVREGDKITGWILFEFRPEGNDWRQRLDSRELVFTTPAAGRALLSFASLHRSTCSSLHWTGPIDEPLQGLQHDHSIELEWTMRAMARILDVPAALTARGYPEALDAEVSLEVEDPHFPENGGPWRFAVSKGSGTAEEATSANARCSIQALSSMFTGMLHPADARRVGGLDADDSTVDRLGAIFAGPTPWLSDFF